MRHLIARGLAALLVTTVVGLAPSEAQTIAYDVGTPTVGTQAFGGSLGLDFDVNSSIVVTDIGVFDSNQDGLATTLTAQLWTRDGNTGTLIGGTETEFTAGDPGTLVNGSRFKPLASPVTLTPGSYTINAFGYNGDELNGNTGGPADKSIDDGGGLITFVGGGRFGNPAAPGTFPGSADGGPVNRYAAGTFIFIPEPATVILMGLGMVILCSLRRRR